MSPLEKNPGRFWMVLEAGGSLWNSNHQHHPLHISCLKLVKRVPTHTSNVDCHQERWLFQNGPCSSIHVPPGEAAFDAQEGTMVGPGATSTMQSTPGIWGHEASSLDLIGCPSPTSLFLFLHQSKSTVSTLALKTCLTCTDSPL